jgi:hypothetical protein
MLQTVFGLARPAVGFFGQVDAYSGRSGASIPARSGARFRWKWRGIPLGSGALIGP